MSELSSGLAEHLREAIALNRARRAHYESVAGSSARTVSIVLVAAERLLVPAARLIDRSAKRFVDDGIPIIVADLVPMAGARKPDTPLERRWILDPGEAGALRTRLRRFAAASSRDIKAHRFKSGAQSIERAIEDIRRVERAHRCNLAMTAHVLESAGFAALNGVRWSAATLGASKGLSAQYAVGQLRLLRFAFWLDRVAQSAHAKGAGILVNDLPPIPFPEPPPVTHD